MKILENKYLKSISGAIRNIYTCEFVDNSNHYVPTPRVDPYSNTDWKLAAILAGNASVFGCINGARTGGIYGCIAGGSIAGTGTAFAFMYSEAYHAWKENKK